MISGRCDCKRRQAGLTWALQNAEERLDVFNWPGLHRCFVVASHWISRHDNPPSVFCLTHVSQTAHIRVSRGGGSLSLVQMFNGRAFKTIKVRNYQNIWLVNKQSSCLSSNTNSHGRRQHLGTTGYPFKLNSISNSATSYICFKTLQREMLHFYHDKLNI